MPSDLIVYTVLASIFIVIGLRMFVEKTGKPSELLLSPCEHEVVDEKDLPKSVEA